MTPKLYKPAEVCEMTQVPAYVLRSWEKEFPGIGVQKSAESGRLYRQSDVDQVLRIKELVFAEGLTLAGARRRLEELEPPTPVSDEEVAEVIEALGANARIRLVTVREGLESILKLLSERPRTNGQPGDVTSKPRLASVAERGKSSSKVAARGSGRVSLQSRSAAAKASAPKVRSMASRPKAEAGKARPKGSAKNKAGAKRKRASA
jgi:DNA-binding transcriptional MerR regulator